MSVITFRQKKNFPLTQIRAFNSLPMQVVQNINMLTLDPKFPPKIVGSYKYAVHEYPSDIDLFEFYQGCCGFQVVREKVIKRFAEILGDIEDKPMTYLGDFKAGEDKRYAVNIGSIEGTKKIRGYDAKRIREDIRKLHDQKLLDDEEVAEWIRAVHEVPTVDEYSMLKELIHDKCVVRWTKQEVDTGYKKLKNGHLLSFEDAISSQSIVKIDIWTNISGRYTEITNWYAITYLEDGTSTPKFISSPIDDYEQSLKREINYLRNHALRKAMKYSKRLWNYYVLKDMKKEMILLYPLFSSGAAKMHQIVGEIDTIINILYWISKCDMESIKYNIEDWKTRIGTLLEDSLPSSIAYSIFDRINQALYSRSKTQIIDQITEVKLMLQVAINKYSKRFLKRNNIPY